MAKVTKLQTTAVQGTNTNVAENLQEKSSIWQPFSLLASLL
jgi:hypothetical protein